MLLMFIISLQECFKQNVIDGRKLILIEASAFPNIGITDFEHIKVKLTKSSFIKGCFVFILIHKILTHV